MNDLNQLLEWVNRNAFLRPELQVKLSSVGGLGVFIPDLSVLDEDPLLMRIPKSNILCAKNSSIYNLLVDYEFEKIDISTGIFALIIATIYEVSFNDNSPWFEYLQTLQFQTSFTPIFQWTKQDKLNSYNTDIEKLGLLHDDEFMQFYKECCRFSKLNQSIVDIPLVLLSESDDNTSNLEFFGKIFTSVTSRAFMIDNFLEISLVPFADLFNHISPKLANGKLIHQENIHFVCDSQVCDDCGEQGCDHDNEDEEEDDDDDDDDEDEGESDESIHEIHNEKQSGSGNELNDSDNNDSDDSDDSDASDGSMNDSNVESNEDSMEDISEITMDYISKMEQELEDSDSESETLLESDEESTIEDVDPNSKNEIESIDDELAQELSDASKCIDVVMVRLPSQEFDFELFNSYGSDLTNIELLQKYGFTCDDNPNDCISLASYFIQSFKNSKLTKEKRKQLQLRLEWFEEEGFELINEIIQKDHDHSHEDENEENNEDELESDFIQDDGNEKSDEFNTSRNEDCCLNIDLPKSWQSGVKIKYDGKLSIQANCLENLLSMKQIVFTQKILAMKVKTRMKNIKQFLMVPCQETDINNMCKFRIKNYKPIKPSDNCKTIEKIVQTEKNILSRFIQRNSLTS